MKNQTPILATLVAWFVTGSIVFFLSKGGASWNGIPVFVVLASIAFLMQWLIFIPSYLYKTEHFFDLTGAVTYLTLLVSVGTFLTPQLDARSFILLGLVGLWASRLGLFLFRRVRKANGDSRFTVMKTQFWPFFMTWNLQGLWVFLTAIAALTAITSPIKSDLQLTGWIGIAFWLFGFAFEVISDRQKTAFRANPDNKGQFIQQGLWSISRHPNYFGEIVLWIGIAIIAFPVLEGWTFLALISPVFVFFLLTKVSGIPLLEAQGHERWGDTPAYQHYLKHTPVLIPKVFARKVEKSVE
jgi:steroid 5-alpha reductase family enzyme